MKEGGSSNQRIFKGVFLVLGVHQIGAYLCKWMEIGPFNFVLQEIWGCGSYKEAWTNYFISVVGHTADNPVL